MSQWKELRTQADIDLLTAEYCGFHDSCIVSAHFETGSSVDEKGVMKNGTENDKALNLVFNSQSVNKTLELSFSGVRNFGFIGWQEGCFCEIYGCYLKIDNGLIVWTDSEDFLPDAPLNVLDPAFSFVVASTLKWRFK